MPFLTLGDDRRSLRAGETTLGGPSAGSAFADLASLPASAVIVVRPGEPVTIRRVSAAVMVRVNDEALGAAPHELVHGARIDIGPHRLRFEDPGVREPEGSTAATAVEIPSLPIDAPARLVELRTGRIFPVTDRGVSVGRETDCDVSLGGKGVSRRHATIAHGSDGFTISDAGSANGTYVNGERVTASRLLRHGDVVRVHREQLRFEVAGHAPEPRTNPHAATQLFPSEMPLDRLRDAESGEGEEPREPRATPAGVPHIPGMPLAILVVTQGPLGGSTFTVDRPVCAIGRGEQNDIRVLEDSVSKLHATLLLKGDTWYVVDLRSANGTFVDGSRIAGERVLPAGGTLRLGHVEMTFRPGPRRPMTPRHTLRIAGFLRRLARRF